MSAGATDISRRSRIALLVGLAILLYCASLSAAVLIYFSFPNRPAGRIISTMAMITNTTMLEASG